jgi:hypothetical protein
MDVEVSRHEESVVGASSICCQEFIVPSWRPARMAQLRELSPLLHLELT